MRQRSGSGAVRPRLTCTSARDILVAVQSADSLKQFLEGRMPEALEILRQMVGINSFTANRDGVNRLGKFTADCFAPLGFGAEFVPCTNAQFGKHLMLTKRGCSNKNIAMISH